uniref:Uncharacterized protein n=1 Tax=uncultured prokaryote TaxID=198431 RepID=A0A0H5Q5H6_9ZZZZ|nr:hypothetical protein [uncultured prokaryote]
MAITRVTALWTGFTGAPGYSNFFFSAFGAGDFVNAETARVRGFFDAMKASLPSTVTVQVQQEAAILDEASGDLISYAQAEEPVVSVKGTASGAYSAPAGAVVTWNTETVARGRRLRGRTFIVPLGNIAYDPDGSLLSTAIANLNAGAAALIGDGTGPQAVIWSRPRTGSDGSIGPITSSRVADKVAVLRSRRD